MKQPYDRIRKQRRVDPRLPPGAQRRSLREKRAEAAPPDRKGVWILFACVILVVAVPAGIHLFVGGGSDGEEVVVRKSDGGWDSAADDLLEIQQSIPAVPDGPRPAEKSVDTAVVASVIPAPPTVEPPAAAPERASASPAVATPDKLFKDKRLTRKEIEAAKAAKRDGENRYFTLELSGSVGGAELDPEDSQTWARLSYFVQQEARRPHWLVYPDGSVPSAAPVVAKGGPAPRRPAAAEELEPGGDPAEPAYRLVIQATASQGGAVTFLRQRLASSFHAQVTCRIDRRVGDSWKRLATTSATESITPQAMDASAADYIRRVYDATIEKLTLQLAGHPPFAAAPGSTR